MSHRKDWMRGRRLWDSGMGVGEIATVLGRHRTSVSRQATSEGWPGYPRRKSCWQGSGRDPVKQLARRRAFNRRHRKRLAAAARSYREQHPERIRANRAAFHQRHREKEIERCRAYRAQHPGRASAYARAYRRSHREQVRLNVRRRGALRRAAHVAAVVPSEIFARDGWICRLCGKPVNPTARGKLGPSLDHVRPLAKGGTHEPGNVQLAHMRCNSSKNDRQ